MKNQPGTMKNQPATMKNHENRPQTMKNQPGISKNVTHKQNLPIDCRAGYRYKSQFEEKTIHMMTYWVPSIARSWDPGSEEVETGGGNGRKWERE